MNHKIKWERWRDPFAKFLECKDDEEFDLESSKQEFDLKEDTPVIVGPFGVMPIHKGNIPSANFNFWLGYTTFRITNQIADIINFTPGIETFEVFTPYRIRVSIARMFDEDFVKKNLEDNILNSLKNETKIDNDNTSLKNVLNKQYKFWAILKINDKDFILYDNDKESLLNKIKGYKYESIECSW